MSKLMGARCLVALIAALIAGCGRGPVTLANEQSRFEVPREYVSQLSYPGLWGLSGGDDDSHSLALRIPGLSEPGQIIFGVLHLTSIYERSRLDSQRSRLIREINEATGVFSVGNIVEDVQLGGVRAIPADVNNASHWYFLRRKPPGLVPSDLIARCATDTPDRLHWSCQLEAEGRDFLVQLTLPLQDMAEWSAVEEAVVALVEGWRVRD